MTVSTNFRSFLTLPYRRKNLLDQLCFLTSTNMSIKTFVFMDLETTGLPHLEHNQTKITEFCAVAVQADHIELGCFPRVHNKLSLCFNPRKTISLESTNITGLSNELLEKQSCFSSDTVDIIKKWLSMNQEPICLVAHNGNRFDYPIFRAEIEKTGSSLSDDVLCVDSLSAFRQLDKNGNSTEPSPSVKKNENEKVPFEFDDGFDELLCQAAEEFERKQGLTPEQIQKMNETTPKKQKISSKITIGKGKKVVLVPQKQSVRNLSYKLGDVYTRLTSKVPINLHEAEGDVVMLITCAAVYGEKFVEYAKHQAVKFNSIPKMKSGIQIA